MNKALKLIPIGNSTGVILPKDVLATLGVGEGDEVFPVRTPHGVELRRADPDFVEDMLIARKIMRERRAVLRELSK